MPHQKRQRTRERQRAGAKSVKPANLAVSGHGRSELHLDRPSCSDCFRACLLHAGAYLGAACLFFWRHYELRTLFGRYCCTTAPQRRVFSAQPIALGAQCLDLLLKLLFGNGHDLPLLLVKNAYRSQRAIERREMAQWGAGGLSILFPRQQIRIRSGGVRRQNRGGRLQPRVPRTEMRELSSQG